jgi:hypothetical protein
VGLRQHTPPPSALQVKDVVRRVLESADWGDVPRARDGDLKVELSFVQEDVDREDFNSIIQVI